MLRKTESVYYPQTIRASSSSSSKVNTLPQVADLEKSNPSKVPPSFGSPPGVNGKEAEVTKGVAPGDTKPLADPHDPIKDNEAPRMEIVLATLPLPAKGDPKGTGQGSLEAVVPQSQAPPQGKIVIKKKQNLIQFSFSFFFSFFLLFCNFCFGFHSL